MLTPNLPRGLGCRCTPSFGVSITTIFLTQDYDPASHAYDTGIRAPIEGCVADSPTELACYRATYAQFMESHLSKEDRVKSTRSRQHAFQIRSSRKQAAKTTRRSLIISTLHAAAKALSPMQKRIVHLFDQIEELTAAQWPEESSSADYEEQKDGEEAEEQDEDTGESEVEITDIAKKESSPDTDGSKGKAISVEQLSVDELMSEIEKLTGISSASDSTHVTTQTSTDMDETSPADKKTADLGVVGQKLRTEDTNPARKPKVARVCGWLSRKLRRGAKRLHKKPKRDDIEYIYQFGLGKILNPSLDFT